MELCLDSRFDTDSTLSASQGSDDDWSCCNFHLPDSKLSESNVLCRHTVATLRRYVYNQVLLLHGQILLVFSWSLVILPEPFNIIRYFLLNAVLIIVDGFFFFFKNVFYCLF